ncbi:MAG: glycosyl hydrolase family 28-related protein [Planctomycetota bacterium]
MRRAVPSLRDSKHPTRRQRQRKLRLQPLETRQLMAGDAPSLTSEQLRFFLADINTDEVIAEVRDGTEVDSELLRDRTVTLFAEARDEHPDFRSVRIRLGDLAERVENRTPYSVTGDRNGDFRRGFLDLNGEYEVTAETYTRTGTRGDLVEAAQFSFTVSDSSDSVLVDVTTLNDEILAANPEIEPAVADDSVDDAVAIQAAIDWLSQKLEEPEIVTATLYLPPGTFEISESLQFSAGIDVLGAGAQRTTLTNTESLSFERADISDSEINASSVNRAGYLLDFDRDSDGSSLRDMTLTGEDMIGGVFANRSDDLEIAYSELNQFLYSGIRTFSVTGSEIHHNEFVNAGGRKLNNSGDLGANGGGIFATFHVDAEVYNNRFSLDNPETNYFGIKGRKWTDSRIHHNTIGTNFSIELPFENDRGVEIDHNSLAGVVSIPKFAGGPVFEEGYSFYIHHNAFASSYAIEGARNNLIVDSNVFEFDIASDGGNLITNFGNNIPVPGPTTFTNNLVVNPGRGIFSSSGTHNELTFANNLIVANQTATPRTSGLFGLKAIDNGGTATDFSTVSVVDNIIEFTGVQRPLFRNTESYDSVIENNLISGASDDALYENPETGAQRGPLTPLVFNVGVAGERPIDGDAIAAAARNAPQAGIFDADGDQVADNFDPAPNDENNGLHRVLGPGQSIVLDFEVPDGTSPIGEATGLQGVNVDPDAVDTFYESDPYGLLTSESAVIEDGLLQVLTSNSDGFRDRNQSADDYGFMVNTSRTTEFTVASTIVMPEGGLPQSSAPQIGIQVGDGTQASYIKFTRAYIGGSTFEVAWENDDVLQDANPGNSSRAQRLSMTPEQQVAPAYRLSLDVDRNDSNAIRVTPRVQAMDTVGIAIGDEIQGKTFTVTGDVADAINGVNRSLPTMSEDPSNAGLFVGVYSTDFSDPASRTPSFLARWEDLSVTSNESFDDAFNNGSAFLQVFLADSQTDEILIELTSGVSVPASLTEGRRLTIFAVGQSEDTEIGSVRLELGRRSKLENSEPYALFGERNGNLRSGRGITSGENEISFVVYSERGGEGDVLENFSLDFILEA